MELSKYLVHTDDDQLYCVLDNSDDSSDETSKIRGVSVLSMSNAQQYFEKQDIWIGKQYVGVIYKTFWFLGEVSFNFVYIKSV